MVIYRGSDGKPGYHQTDDIHDAVGFVEQMRNEQGVEHARIFRLEEVVFQYKPYYRVELADSIASTDEGSSIDSDAPAVTAGDGSSSPVGNGDHGVTNGNGNGNGTSTVKSGDDADTSSHGSDSADPTLGSSTSTADGVATGPAAKRSLFGR